MGARHSFETRVDVDLIKRMLAENKRASEIAAAAGCNERTVYRYKREAHLTKTTNEFSHRPISPERLALVGEYVADGYPLRFISDRLHVSEGTIRRHFPNAGWSREQQAEHARMLLQLRKLPIKLDDIRRYRDEYRIAA
jgi:DNA-binding CsgD family transcriptional regulator